MDYVIIYSDDWNNYVEQISVFDKLKEVNLTVNLAKSAFGCVQVSFLGHTVGQREVKPVAAMVEAISQVLFPRISKS